MNDIYVRSGNCLQKIELNEVYFFTKINGKVIAVLQDIEIEIERSSLYYINELLGNNSSFFRCHKSFIINMTKIEKIIKYSNKTYNIYFKGIKNQAFITQKNLKIFERKISLI